MSRRPGNRDLSVDLTPFAAPVRRWFEANFDQPTPVQAQGWAAIARGEHSLLLAPTGSGKTLAAFLWGLNRLFTERDSAPGIRVVYVSPLKALAYDVDRNLRAPLAGIAHHASGSNSGSDGSAATPRVDLRTGDTDPAMRRRQARDPGDILVTTPESLYLILGSKARAVLETVHTVIIDEVHAIAGTKRGAHLALSLERLSALTAGEPQRIGLSATVEPHGEAAAFLAGERPVAVIDTVSRPSLDLRVSVPVPDMERPAPVPKPRGGSLLAELDPGDGERSGSERGIWEALYPALLEEVRAARSTIIFVNSRSLAERLAQRLNELAEEELAWAHHGSVSHDKRSMIEDGLKGGAIRCIVATSTMELGIDMGRVDRVLLVESPGAVARGLQRVGRAGHQVGVPSTGRIFPKFRGDLLEATVVAERMLEGRIEQVVMPRNPLDVLAQQICAMCCDRPWPRAELAALVRRAGPYTALGDASLDAVLQMLAGRYAGLDGLDLPARITWDRAADVLGERRGTAMVVRVNAGTIPDRGLYAVHLGEGGPRLGELDEEMVFESRPGEVFTLGASSWRVEEITRDRVIVSPAPGEPGRLPFWRGDGPGRPAELGRAIGERTAELAAGGARARRDLEQRGLLDEFAIRNLLAYVDEQRAATGEVPSDRTIVVERFRDELGDWRVCILSPWGARVHAPWAMALERRLGMHDGLEVQLMYADDGIVVRFADTEELPPLDLFFPSPDEVESLIVEQLADTARFAGLFRENAARALLMPRRRPTARSPLWAQRLKSARLLARVRGLRDFPIVLETYREALADAFDVVALRSVLAGVQSAGIRVHEAVTDRASPFARSLVYAYVAAYLYEQDTPLAERRAQALSIDRELLAELVGSEALRDLIDGDVLARVEAVLQALEPDHRARDADELEDLLHRLGDLTEAEIVARTTERPADWLAALDLEARAVRVRIAGEERWIASTDAGLYRDALGVMTPATLPAALLEPVEGGLGTLVARFARRRGPFTTAALAGRYGLLESQVRPVLELARVDGVLVQGHMRPGGTHIEWCDAEVLRRLKRETLAHLRSRVAPVEAPALAAYLPGWQGVDQGAGGTDRLLDVIDQLQGLALPWSLWQDEVLPRRVRGFNIEQLEQLSAMGEVAWFGAGASGPKDGRVVLVLRENLALFAQPRGSDETPWTARGCEAVLALLRAGGARFQTEIELSLAGGAAATGPGVVAAHLPTEGEADDDLTPDEIGEALRELMWAGVITNDTLAPLRSLGRSPGRSMRTRGLRSRSRTPVAGGRWWALPQGSDDAHTRHAVARAEVMLGRYGIVSREMALAENVPRGFSSIHTVLRQMEEGGRVRRGYFVEGLSGAQFAVPGAVDALRAAGEEGRRDDHRVLALASLDPANPYGVLTAWPAVADGCVKPRRVAGSWIVTHRGRALAWYTAGRRSVTLLDDEAMELPLLRSLVAALAALPRTRRHRQLMVESVDGQPVRDTLFGEVLRDLGSAADHRGFTLTPPGLSSSVARA